jgi:hypothetical protein
MSCGEPTSSGRIHASSVKAPEGLIPAELPTVIVPLLPLNNAE